MASFQQELEDLIGGHLPIPQDGEPWSTYYRRTMDALMPLILRALEAANDDGLADDWGRSIGMTEAVLAELRNE